MPDVERPCARTRLTESEACLNLSVLYFCHAVALCVPGSIQDLGEKFRALRLAGAPGLEPGNGGIKIQLVRIDYQGAFRKIEEIRPQSVQEVSEYFGMPGRIPRDAPLPSEGRGHKFESCRARQISMTY